MLIAVNYHYIRPSFEHAGPGIQGITLEQFERQLRLLGSVGTFISASDIRAAIHGQSLPDRALLATFDDGLREQYENAWPILRRLGIPAIFFVNTGTISSAKVLLVHKIHLLRSRLSPAQFHALLARTAGTHGVDIGAPVDDAEARVQYPYDALETARLKYLLNFQLTFAERDALIEACFEEAFPQHEEVISQKLYMDVDQIQELACEACVGTHSHEHLPLGLLSAEEARQQIRSSISLLERVTGRRPFAMSYPYGSQDACSIQTGSIAAAQGVEFAFTMERAGNAHLDLPLHLARFDSNDVPGGKSSPWHPEDFFQSVPIARWHRS